MSDASAAVAELEGRFGADAFTVQETRSGFPTLWTSRDNLPAFLRFLKTEVPRPFGTLYDLTAIDERFRKHRDGQPESDFTVLYHLLSYERNED
ncbi:MAG: NADH-quinone oxidoreductase subunit C, partial [Deltaproteobacteria bacterium]|nr:NADH-quinone oxidoreductase subunit C [Deltaproteobacteria bacterium]